MALIECSACGSKLNTSKNNAEFVNGLWIHKKCPRKSHLPDGEKLQYKELTNIIKKVTDSQNKPLSPAQWKMVTSQIQKLKIDGFDYKQQFDAFKYYFITKGNEYLGYGIMAWVISQCLNDIEMTQSNVDDEAKLREYMEQKRRERLGS